MPVDWETLIPLQAGHLVDHEYHAPWDQAVQTTIGDLVAQVAARLPVGDFAAIWQRIEAGLHGSYLSGMAGIVDEMQTAAPPPIRITDIRIKTVPGTYTLGFGFDLSADQPLKQLAGVTLGAIGVRLTLRKAPSP